MKLALVLSVALLATGCASSNYKEHHELLNKANKAEVAMEKATALQATGVALTVKGKQDYTEAKKEREEALKELSEKLK